MKVRILFFIIFVSLLSKAQINENFTDGNFDRNPEWRGNTENFRINEKLQLQSCALTTSVSSIFTNSESLVNAQWKAQFIIKYSTSSSNYTAMYIISDNENLTTGCNGYYVQIGGTNDEISLFLQQGTKKTKIIDGQDKRIAVDSINVEVKVIRDAIGNFELWSKKASENEYILEGKTQNNAVINSYYFGLLYSNTSTTGKAYIFDNIEVTGEKAEDHINPTIKQLKITDENQIEIEFSERIDTNNLEIGINGQLYKTDSIEIKGTKNILQIKLQYKFEEGVKYEIMLSGITDYSGNYLQNNTINTGIPEDAEIGDLLWNEVMFNHPENSSEYVEIYNRSAKVIELTGMYISTRKTDGTLNSGNKIDYYLLMYPSEYLAFTSSPDSVLLYHNCPQDANVNTLNLSSLNNTSATIVLCSNNKEIIYDELKYNEKWHHTLIKNPKGVALEKINPDMETQNSDSWHSAGSTTNYGTPGYKNSQYKEIYPTETEDKTVWLDADSFSPDNNGHNDLCSIRFKNEMNGYIANVKILNSKGSLVYDLANNKILQPEDYLLWDGKTKSGTVVNAGIYIIYFEAIHPSKSEKIIKKIPVAVTF